MIISEEDIFAFYAAILVEEFYLSIYLTQSTYIFISIPVFFFLISYKSVYVL